MRYVKFGDFAYYRTYGVKSNALVYFHPSHPSRFLARKIPRIVRMLAGKVDATVYSIDWSGRLFDTRHVDTVVSLTRALKSRHKNVYVVGYSYGGSVALLSSSKEKVVSVAIAPIMDLKRFLFYSSFILGIYGVSKSILGVRVPRYIDHNVRKWAKFIESAVLLLPRPISKLKAMSPILHSPISNVLVVHPARDFAFEYERRSYTEKYKNAELLISNSDHESVIKDRDIIDPICKFLRKSKSK